MPGECQGVTLGWPIPVGAEPCGKCAQSLFGVNPSDCGLRVSSNTSDDQVPADERINLCNFFGLKKRRLTRVVPVQDSMRVSTSNSGCTSWPVNRPADDFRVANYDKNPALALGRCSCTCSPGHHPATNPALRPYRRLPALQIRTGPVIFLGHINAAQGCKSSRQTKPGPGSITTAGGGGSTACDCRPFSGPLLIG